MSVRGDVFANLVGRFQGTTSAEGEVHEHRAYGLRQGVERAIVVGLDGEEAQDEEATGFDAESRLLPAQVSALARAAAALLTLAEEVDAVLFALHRDGELREIPRPTFASPEIEGERPVFEATWKVPLVYRVSVQDPSAEV